MTNKQEIFNKVYRHLLSQGKRSINNNGMCEYRTGDGLKCAVGCLIDDKDYKPSLEGTAVNNSQVVIALESSGINMADGIADMLFELQDIHDNHPAHTWKDVLKDLARGLNLELPE